MARFRQAHVHMWKDTWFMALEPLDKLLFMYLFSNEKAHTSGVYELPFPVLLLETGMEAGRARQSLAALQESGRVRYDEESGHCFVRNMMRYNGGNLLTNAKMRANLRSYRWAEGASLRYWDLWAQTYPRAAQEVFDDSQKEQKEKAEQEEKKKAASAAGRASAGAERVSPGADAAAAASSAASSAAAGGETEALVPLHTTDMGALGGSHRVTDASAELSAGLARAGKSQGLFCEGALETTLHLLEEARGEPSNALDRRRLQEMAASAETHRLSLGQGQPGADRAGIDWVRQAIEDANAARRPGSPLSLKFVESVLNRWLAEGYRAAWGGSEPAVFQDVEYWEDVQ